MFRNCFEVLQMVKCPSRYKMKMCLYVMLQSAACILLTKGPGEIQQEFFNPWYLAPGYTYTHLSCKF